MTYISGAFLVTSTTGTSGATSYTVPIQNAAPQAQGTLPVGDGFILNIGVGGSTPPAVLTVKDSQNNLWTAVQNPSSGSSPHQIIFVAGPAANGGGLSTPLVAGTDFLTVTFAAATGGSVSFVLVGAVMRPVLDVSTLTATGSGTAPQVSGTPNTNGEVTLGLFVWANGGGAGSPVSPWTQIGQAQTGTGTYATVYANGAYATPGTALNAQATIVSASWRATMVTFKQSAITWFTNATYIKQMAAATASTATLFDTPTSFSLTVAPTMANPTTTVGNPPQPGSLPTTPSPWVTTPVIKYSSYQQFVTDVAAGVIPSAYKWVMYDTENWPQTPANSGQNTEPAAEEQDPWTYMADFITAAHGAGYRVILAPSRDLADVTGTVHALGTGQSAENWEIANNIHGAAAAAGAEIVHIQAQGDQLTLGPSSTQTTFTGFYSGCAANARAASSYCLVTVGIRSNGGGTPEQIYAATQAVAGDAQGFWFNSTNATISTAGEVADLYLGGGPIFDQPTPDDPTFPNDELDLRVEVLLNGTTWTDVSNRVKAPIQLTRGHPDESTTTAPSTAMLSLYNGDGALTALNPYGPYFGQFGRNTQMRVSVPEGMTYLRSEYDTQSYAQCPSTASLQISGTIDIQVDAALANWQADTLLAGVWNETGNERSWIFGASRGFLTLHWSPDGSSIGTVTSTAQVTPPPSPQRLCVRMVFNPSAGTVSFYTAPAGLSGVTWTQLGSTLTGTATTLYPANAPLQVGHVPNSENATQYDRLYSQFYTSTATWYSGFTGKIYAARLLSGTTVVAVPDFTGQPAGTTSFTDASSNPWTLYGTAEISDRKYRYHGEVAAWPQKWGPVGADAVASIQAGGTLRRLGMGQNPTNSALYRGAIRMQAPFTPVAYWPMEDGANSTQIASALSGGVPMLFTGTPTLSSNSDFACSAAIPVLNGATFSGDITAYTPGTANAVTLLCEVPSSGDTNNGVIASLVMTGGSVARLNLVYTNIAGNGELALQAFGANGASVFSTIFYDFFVNGQKMVMSFQLQGTGYAFQAFAVGTPGGVENFTGSFTLGAMERVIINPGGLLTGTAVGHVVVQTAPVGFTQWYGPANAWAGERAGLRFQRLCIEEGIPFIGRGNLYDTMPMGTQSIETVVSLLQECVDADQSVWTEPRGCTGFGFRTRVSVGNQVPVVVFDYNQDQLSGDLEPTEDDQTTINDFTANQTTDGSSARVVKTVGPMSVNPSPNGVGRYDNSGSFNTFYDSDLLNIASWKIHLGAVNQPRYPGIQSTLANGSLSAAMAYAIQDMDHGDRLQVANPPPWLPPGLIDQIVNQTNETLFIKQYDEKWVGVPAAPWDIGYLDTPAFRLDTSGSSLSNAASGALNANWLFSVPADPNGTPASGSLTDWSASSGSLSLDESVTYPGGPFRWSCVFTGTAGGSILGNGFTAAVGTNYLVGGWVLSPTAGNVQIGLNWWQGGIGGTNLGQSLTSVAVAANTWTPISSAALTATTGTDTAQIVIESPGTVLAVQGVIAWSGGPFTVGISSGPLWTTATGDFPFTVMVAPIPELAAEEVTVIGVSGTSSPQTFTVVRGANGICIPFSNGADMRLAPPPTISM